MTNPGEVYDKYVFVNVFKKVWEKLAKTEYAIKGFEELGIFPFNPQNVKKGKLAPVSIYKWPDPLLEIAKESFVHDEKSQHPKDWPSVDGNKCQNDKDVHEPMEPQPFTSGSRESLMNKPKEPKPMVITIDRYRVPKLRSLPIRK